MAVLFVVLSILQHPVIITHCYCFIPEYGFTPAQFGIVCNMPFLTGVLFGIPVALCDRYGTRKVMLVGLLSICYQERGVFSLCDFISFV